MRGAPRRGGCIRRAAHKRSSLGRDGHDPYSAVLCVIGSATEGRALAPVVRELESQGVNVQVIHLGPLGNGDSGQYCRKAGIGSKSVTFPSVIRLRAIANRHACLVVGNDNLAYNRWLIDEFNVRSKPTILIQEGLTSVSPPGARPTPASASPNGRRIATQLLLGVANARFRELGDRVLRTGLRKRPAYYHYGHGTCSLYCVATEVDKALYSERVSPGTTVVTTGIPGLLRQRPPKARTPSTNGLRVLILSSPGWRAGYGSEDSYIEMLRAIIRNAQSSELVEALTIRPHPAGDDRGLFVQLFGESNVSNHADLERDLQAADVCISTGSTTVLQALSSRLPVILLSTEPYFSQPHTSVEELGERIAYACRNPANIPDALTQISSAHSTTKYREFERIFAPCLDGGAERRIAREVRSRLAEGVQR